MTKRINYDRNLVRDLFFIGLSIATTIFLVRYGVVGWFLNISNDWYILTSFITGLLWTSVFTISPASIAFAHLSHNVDPVTLAAWGALGSMFGDLIIFSYIRDVFSEDIKGAIKNSRFKRFLGKTHFSFLRWFGPVAGAVVIASPLPDEIGLSLMGVSKMKTRYLIPIAFIFNFIGIYLLALVALGLSV